MWQKKIFFILLLFLMQGCASIGGKQQKLKLVSDPEGSAIYHEGQLLGHSPLFIDVPRKSQSELTIKNGSLKKVIPLEGHYRWGDSFFANFVWFFWFAPVGWVTDLITGAAWNYEPIAPFSFSEQIFSKKNSFVEGQRFFSIAPPTSNYVLLSEDIGELLELKTKKRFFRDKTIAFNDTLDTFNYYHYDYAHRTSPSGRDDLYSELKSNQIIESEIIRNDENIEIKATVTDIFTENKWDEFSFTLPNSEVRTFARSSITEILTKILDVVPNTFSFGFKTPLITIKSPDALNPAYVAAIDSSHSVLSYLSSLSFKNTRNPKLVPGLRFYFRFVPSVVLDYTRIKFQRESSNSLSGIAFDWYLLLAGIGPEVGVETKVGYLYFQLIPNFGGSYIHSEGKNKYFDSWNANFAGEVELGFVMFVSDRINLRLYSNAASGFHGPWSETMTYMAGSHIPVSNATDSITGFVFGYYFPESSNKVKNWLF